MSRLAKLPPYLFAEIDAAKRQALAAGRDLVDLGVGDPDRPTPRPILDAMAAAIRRPEHHRYPANRGGAAFCEAVARYARRRLGATVDPARHVLALIGSKEGLGHLPLALLEDGDEVLVPEPGYPVYAQGTLLAGGRPVPFALRPERGYLPNWDELDRLVTPRTRLLYLNYPQNPTGAVASPTLMRDAVAFGERHGVVLAHDAAYLEVSPSGAAAASVLGAADLERQRVIELHSLSKMFNMTGWRIGFALGQPELIRNLGRVKESLDSGVFTAIQEAAVEALGDRCDELLAGVMSVYPPRRAVLTAALRDAGLEVFPTDATFYVWARVPGAGGSLAFCQQVLARLDVVLTPGVGFGAAGEGWFRASLSASDERVAEAAARLRGLPALGLA